MTGRECRGAIGLAGLPQGAAQLPEGYLSRQGIPLRIVGSKPQAGLPSLQHQSQKRNPENIQLWKAAEFLSTRERWAEDTERLLKDQLTKFCLQPLTLDSVRGRAEWTRDASGESGADGSGERTEGTATGIPVLSQSPYCRGHHSQTEHSPPNSISLRGSNSPAHRNYSAPPCGA